MQVITDMVLSSIHETEVLHVLCNEQRRGRVAATPEASPRVMVPFRRRLRSGACFLLVLSSVRVFSDAGSWSSGGMRLALQEASFGV